MNPETKPAILAERLEAMGYYMSDQVATNTPTSATLLEAAKWLRKLDRNMCAQGYIGCNGGSTCSSDHK